MHTKNLFKKATAFRKHSIHLRGKWKTSKHCSVVAGVWKWTWMFWLIYWMILLQMWWWQTVLANCLLSELGWRLVSGFSRHQRTAATHIWVVMVSPETTQSKPYALPVQCIPYKSLTAVSARSLVNDVVKEMVKRGMEVAGKTKRVYMCMHKRICIFVISCVSF